MKSRIFIKKILILIIIFFIFALPGVDVIADIVTLQDGSIIKGKVLIKEEEYIILKNNHGSFQIQRSYITNEVIENPNELNKVDESDLGNIIQIGLPEDRGYYLLSISGAYLVTSGTLGDVIPNGFGFNCALDTDFPFIDSALTEWLNLYLRYEGGFSYFNNSEKNASLKKFMIGLGPVLKFNFSELDFITFDVGFIPGFSVLLLERDNTKGNSYTFANVCFIGVSYTKFENLIINMQGRFNYIYDQEIGYYGFGITLGIGYIL